MTKIKIVKSGWITNESRLNDIIKRIDSCLVDGWVQEYQVSALQNMKEFVITKKCFSEKQLDYLIGLEELTKRANENSYPSYDVNDLPF